MHRNYKFMSSVLLLELVYLGAYEKLEMKERCLSLVQIVRCRPKGLHTLKFFVGKFVD